MFVRGFTCFRGSRNTATRSMTTSTRDSPLHRELQQEVQWPLKKFNEFLASKPTFTTKETWNAYTAFVQFSAERMPLEAAHFEGFLRHFLAPHLRTNHAVDSVLGFPTVDAVPPLEAIKKADEIEEDMRELGIKPTRSVLSWRLIRYSWMGQYEDVDRVYQEAHRAPKPVRLDLEGYKEILRIYCKLHFETKPRGSVTTVKKEETSDESDVEFESVPWDVVTRRKVWSVVTALRKAKLEPDTEVFEMLLLLLGRGFENGKAVDALMTKLNASQVAYRPETFIVCVDALAHVVGDEKKLNKLMHVFKSDPLCPPVGYLFT